MKRILVVTFALIFGAAIFVTGKTHANTSVVMREQATDGAFRDGVYLGKLAAFNGESEHVATGRWTRAADRTAFSIGYQQGYASVNRSNPLPDANDSVRVRTEAVQIFAS